MGKKITIFTLNGYSNYGNRLQNYALENAIKFLNCEVCTAIIKDKRQSSFVKKLKNVESFKDFCNKGINKINIKLKFLIYKNKIINRNNKFIEFSKEFLNEKEPTLYFNNFTKNKIKQNEYFITGSDQVWNPLYPEVTSLYFLTFVPKEKRIAYAPSFGISEIPEEYKENYKKWLSEIKYISVREESGAKIIKELTGRDAPVLVDPTLLLTREKWLTIAKPAKNKPKDKYLVTYFLGGVPKEYKKEIKKFAKNNQLKIINLGDIKETKTYITGPSEFLDYINSCDIIFTDSFHGTVFSILFEKPFVVYKRVGGSSMYSRIKTLLKMFKLESREYKKVKIDNSLFQINYSHVPKILEIERSKSYNYLKEALNIKNI